MEAPCEASVLQWLSLAVSLPDIPLASPVSAQAGLAPFCPFLACVVSGPLGLWSWLWSGHGFCILQSGSRGQV
jgi:hypothetical protein